MEIAVCTLADFQEIHAAFNTYWPGISEEMAARLKILHHPAMVREFGNSAFVIKQDREIIAYLFGFYSQTEPLAYVHALAVRQDHRRAGLASKLYGHFIQLAKAKGCKMIKAITSPGNSASLAFHENLGMAFETVKDYSGPGQARVVMTKAI
jgi:GNAT superfamily N-acetyltransferase